MVRGEIPRQPYGRGRRMKHRHQGERGEVVFIRASDMTWSWSVNSGNGAAVAIDPRFRNKTEGIGGGYKSLKDAKQGARRALEILQRGRWSSVARTYRVSGR